MINFEFPRLLWNQPRIGKCLVKSRPQLGSNKRMNLKPIAWAPDGKMGEITCAIIDG